MRRAQFSRFLGASTVILPLALAACGSLGLNQPGPPMPTYDLSDLQLRAAKAGEEMRLNHLARMSLTANKLYGEAAAQAGTGELRTHLVELADDHGRFARDLQQRVTDIGGDPAQTGEDIANNPTLAAIPSLVENRNIAAVSQIERSEAYLIGELGKTLEGNALSPVSKELVEAQLADAKQGRERIAEIQSRIESAIQSTAPAVAPPDAQDEEDDEPIDG